MAEGTADVKALRWKPFWHLGSRGSQGSQSIVCEVPVRLGRGRGLLRVPPERYVQVVPLGTSM